MMQLHNLSIKFNDKTILNQINLNIEKKDVIAIIGSSGAGKSTLLRCINLLENPTEGIIKIDDLEVDTTNYKNKDLLKLRQYTAMVFQQFNLFKRKTALENVMEGLIVVKKIPKKEAQEIASSLLSKVGLSEHMEHYPQHLSGGQQQRVAIARALAMEPKLLLFDEPTSSLDPELVGEVLETIKQTAKAGHTMLLVSHEMSFVRQVANRVLFLDGGTIIEDGTPEEVFERPKHARTKEFLSRYYNE